MSVAGAVAALCAVEVLGAYLALAALRGRRLATCLASGLLWGTAAHVFVAAPLVIARHVLGLAPLYPAGAVAALLGLALLAVAIPFHRSAAGWGVSSRRVLLGQAAAALVVGAAALLAIRIDLAPLTPDSLGLIEGGLSLARVSDPERVHLAFLGARGLFGVIVHAPAAVSSFDFLWFVTPLFGLSCLATASAAAAAPLVAGGARPALVAGLLALAWLWLLTCYLWLFQLFYVHVNLLASCYVLLFFVGAWQALVEEDERWMLLAGAALLAFEMIRVEGAFFAALAVGMLVLERAAAGRPQGPELWLVLPGALWCGVVAGLIGTEGAIVDGPRTLAMAAALLACLPLGWAARRPALGAWRSRLPAAALVGLAVATAAVLLLAPEHAARRLPVLLANATTAGRWSTAWALVPALVLAGRLFGRVPYQRFVSSALLACLLGLLGLTFVAFWRPGWYDSGNRMLTHALPTLVWLGVLRAGAPLARKREGATASAG